MADDDELERQREIALRDVTWKATLVAGNMLRVIAGAGDPASLTQLCLELGKAIENTPPGTFVWQVREAIEKPLSDGFGQAKDEFDYAIRDIEQASLRIVAARILEQQVQVTRRQNDLQHAIGRLDRARDADRKKYQEERAVTAPPAPLPRKKRKPAAIQAPKPAAKPASPPAIGEDIDPTAWKSTADYMRLRREQLARLRAQEDKQG
jgi:hypothetical protein